MLRYGFRAHCSSLDKMIFSLIYVALMLHQSSSQWLPCIGRQVTTIDKIQFVKGDLLIVRALDSKSIKKLFPPYHYLYAIDDQRLLHFMPRYGMIKGKEEKVAQMFIMEPHIRTTVWKGIETRKVSKRAGVALLEDKGVELARRMKKALLHFEYLSCSCRHYLDYVIYGRTFGSKANPSYLPISHKCPLHRVITPETDVMDPDLTLQTKHGDYCKLSPPENILREIHVKSASPQHQTPNPEN